MAHQVPVSNGTGMESAPCMEEYTDACGTALLHLFDKFASAANNLEELQGQPRAVTAERVDSWFSQLLNISASFLE